MREVKFRIRNTVNGRTDFVSLTQLLTMNNSGISPKMVNDDFQISQYTGLKDKNGVEIYEGDIVVWNGNTETVFFDDGYFQTESSLIDSCMVVVGNIYENPELLESNK